MGRGGAQGALPAPPSARRGGGVLAFGQRLRKSPSVSSKRGVLQTTMHGGWCRRDFMCINLPYGHLGVGRSNAILARFVAWTSHLRFLLVVEVFMATCCLLAQDWMS